VIPRKSLLVVLLCAALLPAHAEDAAAPLGKQRAAGSKLVWDMKDSVHRALGQLRSATLRNPFETTVGNTKVYSRVYFSCEKAGKTFSMELTNGTSLGDPTGLKPANEPRLFCSRPIQPFDEKLVQEELLAHWETGKAGESLTWGLRPFPLRECVSIRVIQDVALPEGSAQKSAKVEFDVFPYSREFDSVFAACGEASAYAAAGTPTAPAIVAAAAPPKPAPPPVAAKPVAVPTPAPAPPPTAVPANSTWQMARTPVTRKTNVRAGPTLQSAIVAELHPGSVVMVQKTGTEWWKARPSSGTQFDGYIREDRLVFK
jgi:hypothetical protein